MTARKKKDKKRGPRGGVKHQPGRGHDKKSASVKKERFKKRAAKERQAKEEAARKLWQEWDNYPDDVKKLLGPDYEPKIPRPKNED